VLYITERCVFALVAHHGQPALELIEIAPGIDLQHDILAHMDFVPLVSAQCKPMDAALFQGGLLGLRQRLLA